MSQWVLIKSYVDQNREWQHEVYGNRHGDPFANKVNAQRSCTKRTNAKKPYEQGIWRVREILK